MPRANQRLIDEPFGPARRDLALMVNQELPQIAPSASVTPRSGCSCIMRASPTNSGWQSSNGPLPFDLPAVPPRGGEGEGALSVTPRLVPGQVSSLQENDDAFYALMSLGTETVVWSGYSVTSPNLFLYDTGGRSRPDLDSWRSTAVTPATPSPRHSHAAVWAGTRMIVWGGTDSLNPVDTGGVYDPFNDSWVAMNRGSNSPPARAAHSAVWTGTEMLIFGGYGPSTDASVWRYAPGPNAWVAPATSPSAPTPRLGHAAVWTGSEMIVFGG